VASSAAARALRIVILDSSFPDLGSLVQNVVARTER
jgi:hypothetical protein